MELIPGLPEEIGLECLTRLSYTDYRVATPVSRRWRELFESREFYNQRKQTGKTHKIACLIQSLPVQTEPERRKPIGSPSYGIVMFDSEYGNWERLDPIPKYPDWFPLFAQLASVEGKLVLLGGWDPVSWNPLKDVFIYDFTTRRWRQGKAMPSKRSFFAASAFDGRIFVAGGHDESKNALKSAWAYNVRSDEWEELSQMSEERDECEAVVIGNEFWVVSGYETEHQGRFKASAELYEIGTNQWKKVEGSWMEGRCPRACIGVGKNGNLICWSELESAIRVGSCAVSLGERTLLTGSAYQGQGAPHEFFLVEMKEGQNVKLEKIQVPDKFSGFVQSGCCVEI